MNIGVRLKHHSESRITQFLLSEDYGTTSSTVPYRLLKLASLTKRSLHALPKG